MRYDKYVKRMQYLNKALNVAYKLRYVFLATAIAGSITTLTVLGVKGQIQVPYDFKKLSAQGKRKTKYLKFLIRK